MQINMFGDLDVMDFDSATLPKKDMVSRWNVLFTPSIMDFPEDVPDCATASQSADATLPGAFGKVTTFNMLNWVKDHGYDGGEPFQNTTHASSLQADFPNRLSKFLMLHCRNIQ